jgi:hypothetical protein
VFAGDLVEAHRRGCEFVRETAMQRVDAPFDIVVATNSGYPLDQNLYQGVKGISAASRIVKKAAGTADDSICRVIRSSVCNPHKVEAFGRCSIARLGFAGGAEELIDPTQVFSSGGNAHDGSSEHSNHPIKKTVPIKLHTNELFAATNANLADGSCRGFNRFSAICSKRGEVMSAGEAIGGCPNGAQVKNLRDVPGSSNFQGMKDRVIPQPVLIHLSDCRILGVKKGRCSLASDDTNLSGQVGVQSHDPFGRIKFVLRYIDMSHLSESMNSGICPSGPV